VPARPIRTGVRLASVVPHPISSVADKFRGVCGRRCQASARSAISIPTTWHGRGHCRPSSVPFSSRHRIRTTSGEILKVVVVGDAVTDQDGRIVAIGGFYIDITDSFITDLQDSIGEETEMIRAHREAQVSRTTTR